MRYVLPSLLAFVGTLAVLACSSSDEKKDDGSSGTIAPLGDGGKSGSSGDDDDDAKAADCRGVTSLDCAKQTAHAKEAACTKFDAKQWTDDCESLNCGTSPACAKELKDLGDCLLEEPAVCNEAGGVDNQTPTACKDKEAALFNCDTENP